MSRLNDVFSQTNRDKRGRPAFVAFITAGYPSLDDTVDVMLALEEGGANVIELGIPHSDPTADGSTIQESSNIALAKGITMNKCLSYVKDARARGLKAPVILMGYYNSFLSHGEEEIIKRSKEAGADGFIIVDLPVDPSESEHFRALCKKHEMHFVPLVAPNTANTRLQFVNSIGKEVGMVYCVSVLGVTGSRTELPPGLPDFVKRVKRAIPTAPVAVGFGISNRENFVQVARMGVDAIVVGSAIVKAVGAAPEGKRAEVARELAKKFTTAAPGEESLSFTQEHATPNETESTQASQEYRLPSKFGQFGGRYASETLMGALEELETSYAKLKDDPDFLRELRSYYNYVGRPTPIYYCERLSKETGGAQIWLKREDLAHTGAHKINNAIGQALLAKRLGKKRIIAETGAGQHGVATATVCAKLGLECIVYMGSEDVQRQSLNVFRMKMLGATVVPVSSGSKTLKDAINEAMRDWVTNVQTTHYLVGSAIGPHPFPTIVRDFQSVIGKEARAQFLECNGKLPNVVVACVGGGSNAIGMFHPFVGDKEVRLLGVEAAGSGVHTDKHCATLSKGRPGVLHGTRTYLLQDEDGQITETHSVSAGLDYPGVGPEHAFLKDCGRAEYVSVDDKEALEGFKLMTRMEGIIPALETSHAIYYAVQEAKKLPSDQTILICMSGRGDKDMGTVAKELGITL